MRVFAGHASEHGIDVGVEIALRRHDRCGTIRLDGDRIDEKAVLRIDGLIAGSQIGMREKLQQLIRTRAADDALRH